MKILALVLLLAVAARVHVAVMLYGCPLSVPVLWYAAVVAGLPLVVVLLAGRRAMRRNRHPRFYWQAVTA